VEEITFYEKKKKKRGIENYQGVQDYQGIRRIKPALHGIHDQKK
jgi:hypothetical protein